MIQITYIWNFIRQWISVYYTNVIFIDTWDQNEIFIKGLLKIPRMVDNRNVLVNYSKRSFFLSDEKLQNNVMITYVDFVYVIPITCAIGARKRETTK